MARVIDPVCGLPVDPKSAVAATRYAGDEFYFESIECKREFDENPLHFRKNIALADRPQQQKNSAPSKSRPTAKESPLYSG
jgi:Cu+-exporting ATPase